MAPHFGVTSARARALHALAAARRASSSRPPPALLPRVSAPDASAGRLDRAEARTGDLARADSASCWSTPASRAKTRPTSTASSPSAAASSTSSRPASRARAPRVRRRHDRVAPPLRSGHAAIGPDASIRSAIVPLRDVRRCSADVDSGPADRSHRIDRLPRRRARASIVVRARRSARRRLGAERSNSVQATFDGARAGDAASAARCCRRTQLLRRSWR